MKRVYQTAGILIVVCWIALMAMLAVKQIAAFRPVQLDKQFIGATVESRQEWSGIYLKGSKIGYSSSELKRIEEGYHITEEVFMDLTVMDMPQRIQTHVNVVADGEMRLQIFSFKLTSGVISMSVSGTVQGQRMRLNILTGGKKEFRYIPLKEPPVLANSIRYFLLKKGIKPGMNYSLPFFDPLTLSTRTIQVTVLDKEPLEINGARHDCYKVQTSFQGMTTASWVNEQGDTLREESTMGLVLVREDREQAMNKGWGEKPDIVAASSIKVSRAFSAQGLSFLKLRLKNVSLDGFALNEGRQRLAGDIVEIRREEISPADMRRATVALPAMEPFLHATPFIQCDSPVIRDFVRQQAGREKSAYAVVRNLTSWVYKNIEKKPTLSIPSALEVLEKKQGDCNEHAVLLTALCRAAGVPSRVAAGLVHLNGSFFYHAWCEVFLGSWVSVDPTMDQVPADVSHIKFVDGDLENQISILKLIGKLEIDVLEFL
ncbi:MAG: transglutaminase domain-containing protein [Deltaproteobacteria bacterium]|nr:transglutaminase domain-containing protein [Deltaproteobacteria bacterium]